MRKEMEGEIEGCSSGLAFYRTRKHLTGRQAWCYCRGIL